MTIAALLTYYPERDLFDEVLESIRTNMRESKEIAPVLEARLFSDRDRCEIRSYSLWRREQDFDDYMNFRINQGVFNEQGRMLRHEIECRLFNQEVL